MIQEALAIVILAAGKGTRMHSHLPKVLHPVAGESMLAHVLTTASHLKPARLAVVIGPDMQPVEAEARRIAPNAAVVVQQEQLGTADAVKAAKAALKGFNGQVMVMYGDTPLVSTQLIERIQQALEGHAMLVVATEPPSPKGYGRICLSDDGKQVVAIVEEKDATPEQKTITRCNSGLMAVRSDSLWALLDLVDNRNKSGEYYLTDLVGLARKEGLSCGLVDAPFQEVMGVNSRRELAQAEAGMQERLRRHWMDQGVTMMDPASVFLSRDTRLAPDVTLHPNVVMLSGVTVERGVEVRAFSHLEGCYIGENAVIGPFARIRPGTRLDTGTHIGNFVEIKNAHVGTGTKINHLSYIGDASVGQMVNVGAGTITCNYDGFSKFPTVIGDHAFIGSNSALVAPVTVGESAIVGAGSTVVEDVPADAMAIARPPQVTMPGKGRDYRQNRGSQKRRLT